VRDIVQHLPESRQTLLFSATIPPPIENLSKTILRDPVFIAVGMVRVKEKERNRQKRREREKIVFLEIYYFAPKPRFADVP
jgi:ATP-dependent RNA helicase DeaD